MKNPIFLISTGRTGTKYFANFFSTYGVNVTAYHTSKFTRLLNILSNMYYYQLLSIDLMKSLWKQLKYEEIEAHTTRYVECNPYYYNLIDIISTFFPEGKFLFITRSPKSFIISHIKWERQRWQSVIANRLIPFWQPVSYLDQIRGLGNDYYQRVEFYSKIWFRKNSAVLESITGKDNAMKLKFEDVFHPEKGVDVMKVLMKWLDITLIKPIDREIVTQKINITKDTKDLWDENCAEIMKKYCRFLMVELGYDKNH